MNITIVENEAIDGNWNHVHQIKSEVMFFCRVHYDPRLWPTQFVGLSIGPLAFWVILSYFKTIYI